MINLNISLLKKYFLLNTKHNVLYNILDSDNIIIQEKDIDIMMSHLAEIMKTNKQNSGLYMIANREELFSYIVEFIYHKLKIYISNFDTEKEFKFFIYVNIALFLTLFSQDALNLLKYIPDVLRNTLTRERLLLLNSYIDSNDPRGLIYYLLKKNNLSYDNLLLKEEIVYEYTEPSINRKWQKNYKLIAMPIMFWFYKSIIGNALFLVLYTPKCRYKMEKGGCSGCNLPTVSDASTQVNSFDIHQQIDKTFENDLSLNEKESIQELMLSNNGSILDPLTMDIDSLKYAVSKAVKVFPNLKKIIFETRIDDYTNIKQLEVIKEMIEKEYSHIILEIAVGFEIFNDKLRNGYYKKGLQRDVLEEKMQNLSTLDISLKVYMMYKAVPNYLMSVDEAIEDLNLASNYFSDFASKYNLKINLHISPTYLATGTPLYIEYKNGTYTPPSMQDIDKMYNALDIKDNLSYYISMNDEGLAEVDSLDYDVFMSLREKISKFNISNYK